jgi:hypothetical protein
MFTSSSVGHITLHVQDGASSGHQAPVKCVVDFLHRERFQGHVGVLAASAETSQKLALLCPPTRHNTVVNTLGKHVCVVPAFDDLSSEERHALLNHADAALLLQPYQWKGSPEGRYVLYRNGGTVKEELLELPHDKAFYPVVRTPVEDIPTHVQETLRDTPHSHKQEALCVFLHASQNGTPCMVVYGLHALACPEPSLHTLLCAVQRLAEEKGTQALVLVLSNTTPKIPLDEEHVRMHTTESFTQDTFNLLQPGDVACVLCGPVPQTLFNTLCAHSTWPLVLEGANTMNTAACYGIPFLPLGSRNGKNPLPLNHPAHQPARALLHQCEEMLVSHEDSLFYSTTREVKKLLHAVYEEDTEEGMDEHLLSQGIQADTCENLKAYLAHNPPPRRPKDHEMLTDQGVHAMMVWEQAREHFMHAFEQHFFKEYCEHKGFDSKTLLPHNTPNIHGVYGALRAIVQQEEPLQSYFKQVHQEAQNPAYNQLSAGFTKVLALLDAC